MNISSSGERNKHSGTRMFIQTFVDNSFRHGPQHMKSTAVDTSVESMCCLLGGPLDERQTHSGKALLSAEGCQLSKAGGLGTLQQTFHIVSSQATEYCKRHDHTSPPLKGSSLDFHSLFLWKYWYKMLYVVFI